MIEYERDDGTYFEGILSEDNICLNDICPDTKVRMQFLGAKYVEGETE